MNEKTKQIATQNKLGSYKKTDVITANRETILLMMYAAAMRFIKSAIEATEKKDEENRSKFIQKTQDIVTELRSNLNFEIGGDLAKNLDELYEFVTHSLATAHVDKALKPLEDAQKVMNTLNEAWETAIESLKKERIQKQE